MTSAAEPGRVATPAAASTVGNSAVSPLEPKELAKILKLDSPKLVEELWQITQKQLDVEITRHTRLEGKAASLLTTAGLSLTVAFTFGSTLLAQAAAFQRWHDNIVVIFAIAIFSGLVSAIYAVRALALREQLSVNERSVFDQDALRAADQDSDLEKGLMEFRKGRIIHFWAVRQRYSATYREKSKLVKRGQWFFLGFLLALVLLCTFVVYGVVWVSPHG
jgi:hypothetical protein